MIVHSHFDESGNLIHSHFQEEGMSTQNVQAKVTAAGVHLDALRDTINSLSEHVNAAPQEAPAAAGHTATGPQGTKLTIDPSGGIELVHPSGQVLNWVCPDGMFDYMVNILQGGSAAPTGPDPRVGELEAEIARRGEEMTFVLDKLRAERQGHAETRETLRSIVERLEGIEDDGPHDVEGVAA